MYYIAKKNDCKNTYAVGDNVHNRFINNAYHFSEDEYKEKGFLYKCFDYTFIKILDDGTKVRT